MKQNRSITILLLCLIYFGLRQLFFSPIRMSISALHEPFTVPLIIFFVILYNIYLRTQNKIGTFLYYMTGIITILYILAQIYYFINPPFIFGLYDAGEYVIRFDDVLILGMMGYIVFKTLFKRKSIQMGGHG